MGTASERDPLLRTVEAHPQTHQTKMHLVTFSNLAVHTFNFQTNPNPKFLIKSKNNLYITNSWTDSNDMGEGRRLEGNPLERDRGRHEAEGGRSGGLRPPPPTGDKK